MKMKEVTQAFLGNVAAMNDGKVSADLLATLDLDHEKDSDVADFLSANGITVDVTIETCDTEGLSADDEMKLIVRAKKGDKEAMTDLLLAYGPLVLSLVRDYSNANTSGELKSIANECFIKVVNKFDPCKGRRLAPYARRAITLAFYDYLHSSHMIKIPVYTQRKMDDLNKYAIDHNIVNGWSEEHIKAAAKELDMTEGKVKEYLYDMNFLNVSSIEANTKSNDDSSNSDYDDSGVNFKKVDGLEDLSIEDAYIKRDTMSIVDKIIEEKLDEKQREVVNARYFTEDNKNRSTAKVAKLLNMEEKEVMKILYKVHNILKEELKIYGIGDSALC